MKVFYVFSLVCSLSWLSHQKEAVQNASSQKVVEKKPQTMQVVVAKPKGKLTLAKDSVR